MASRPRISGRFLQSLAAVASTRGGAAVAYRLMRGDLKIDQLPGIAPHLFGDIPLDNSPVGGRPPREFESADLPLPAPPWSGTSATRTAAYAAGSTDPFARYARALELKQLGRLDESLVAFDELRALEPSYLAQYLMAGGVAEALGRREDARAWYTEGVTVARVKGDTHALGEIQQALSMLT